MKKAPVNKIIPFSNVDGPGNRTAIFFQGCTFNCLFCHNPETIRLCDHCGQCVGVCPTGALEKDSNGKVVWDFDLCTQCDSCIKTCPGNASPKVMWMSVDDIMKEMSTLLEQSKAAVEAAEDVKSGNSEQQIAIGETLEAVNGMLEDIGSTVGGVQLISEGADTCATSKNAVVDTMSALSAISEENAASSEETGASMQELSATVMTLASSADGLKDIAEQLNEEMKFFKS